MSNVKVPDSLDEGFDSIRAILESLRDDQLRDLKASLDLLPFLDVFDKRSVPLAVGKSLDNCKMILSCDNLEILKNWIGLNVDFDKVDFDKWDLGNIKTKSLKVINEIINLIVARESSIGYLVDEMVGDTHCELMQAGGKKVYGLESGGYPELLLSEFPNSKDGDVLFEGKVKLSLAFMSGLGCDCEYVLAEDGKRYFDNYLFRGFGNKQVRVKRSGDGFKVEEAIGRVVEVEVVEPKSPKLLS